jgi:hypothetical protein
MALDMPKTGLRRGMRVMIAQEGMRGFILGTVFDYRRNYSSVRVHTDGGEDRQFGVREWDIRVIEDDHAVEARSSD